MVRRVIDADNSCLFNAVGYLMEKSKKVGAKLRGVIAVRGSQPDATGGRQVPPLPVKWRLDDLDL